MPLDDRAPWVEVGGSTFDIGLDFAAPSLPPNAQHRAAEQKESVLQQTADAGPEPFANGLRHFASRGIIISPKLDWVEQVAPPFVTIAHVLGRAVTRNRNCYAWELDEVADALSGAQLEAATDRQHLGALAKDPPKLITSLGQINFNTHFWRGAVAEEVEFDGDTSIEDTLLTRMALDDFKRRLEEGD